MASTFRFPEDLKAEASAYAAKLGVSLNALCAVALRDYLDSRKAGQSVPSAQEPDLSSPAGGGKGPVRQPELRPAHPLAPGEKREPNVVFDLGESLRESIPVAKRSSKKRRKR